MTIPNPLDIYMAGVMDSDGSFSIGHHVKDRSRVEYQLRARITWSVPAWPALDSLHREFGGRLSAANKPRSDKHSTCRTWQIAAAGDLICFIDRIEPWLLVKKKQAQLLRETSVQLVRNNGRHGDPAHAAWMERAYAAMQEMNRTGRQTEDFGVTAAAYPEDLQMEFNLC